jgi:ATP-binding cassette, subfamily B, bacterial
MREWWRGVRLMLSISWRADAPRTLAALVTASGQTVVRPLRALGMKELVDGVASASHGRAVGGILLMVIVAAVDRVMSWMSLNVRMRLRENTQLYLDARLMEITAGIPSLEHHERPEYLDKLELVRNERGHLANPFNPISWSVAFAAETATVLALMAAVHPLLLLLPLLGIPSLVTTFRAEKASANLDEKHAEPHRVRRHLFDLLTAAPAAKEVRIFGLAGELAARRRRLFDQLERDQLRLQLRSAALNAGGWLVFAAGYLAAVVFTVHLVAIGRASVGSVVLVLSLGAQVDQQLGNTAENITWFVHAHRAVRRLLWLMSYAESAHEKLRPATPRPVPERLTSGISFRDVSFSYPGTDKTVLADVNLQLPAGRTVAIVGDNGAGKTTLVKLLCRFYEPSAGAITVDGVALRDFSVDEWRSRLSAGFQDFAKLSLLARESIGVGDASRISADTHLVEALERAAASQLVATLPRGLDTQLGREFDGGVELSIGQWQKVALGRSMMRQTPLLLVLDEPTASLDAPTEHELFERFTGAARRAAQVSGAITILISHRFSTVRMADLILVVANGRIAEQGDHAALIRAGGLYAQLYELQARAYR